MLCMLSCFDIYFDVFLYFTCGVSDLVGRRIATLLFLLASVFLFVSVMYVSNCL
jgi:hypothetical protein